MKTQISDEEGDTAVKIDAFVERSNLAFGGGEG
jgi:hypothetical protein